MDGGRGKEWMARGDEAAKMSLEKGQGVNPGQNRQMIHCLVVPGLRTLRMGAGKNGCAYFCSGNVSQFCP